MLFRNRRFARVVACYLLLQTISSLAFPTVSLAMMGPSQPEFTSYEAPGATDLVNLTTGDFSYSIPILDIPGPERSFSLPLNYKAGIQLEQEASWVGLGWSLNPGAISRTVNGYADDAAGAATSSRFDKEIDVIDQSVVIPGIYTQTVSKYNGSGGAVDLLGLASVNWDKNGLAGGDLVGISYQKGQGLTADPVRVAMAAVTVATLGGGSVASTLGKAGLALAEGSGAAMLVGISMGRLGGSTSYNNGAIDHTTGDWAGSERRIFFLNTVEEVEYGSLYFGKMSQRVNNTVGIPNAAHGTGPTIQAGATSWSPAQFQASRRCDSDNFGNQSSETAADIYQFGNVDPLGQGRAYDFNRTYPISVAHDRFDVMGEGVSGTIRPYRLEVGSVAYPKLGTQNCYDHAKYMVVPFLNNYKVGFRYENELSNEYDYHQNGQDVGFKLSADKQSVTITDQRLFDNNNRLEGARKGLVNEGYGSGKQGLVQGKHVVWYSNSEIERMTGSPFTGYPNGFLDFDRPTADNSSPNVFRHQLPVDGIGALAITMENGSTYHYSLPVYQSYTSTEANEVRSSATIGKLGKYTSYAPGYATTWLLTAITSPDYIDRNSSGTVDDADWGGWVRFNYGRYSPHYGWRQPYVGTSYSADKKTIDYESFTSGERENYYLNTISTRTHTALFVKSVRQDGRGYPINNSEDENSSLEISSVLRLDEIILLDNATLRKLQTPDGINTTADSTPIPAFTTDTQANAANTTCKCSDDLRQVLDTRDLTVDTRINTYIQANAIKRIHFNYAYDLCRGVPNSFAVDYTQPPTLPSVNTTPAGGYGGKLTLKSVSFFGPTIGKVPTKIIPDFTFSYEAEGHSAGETNPGYDKERWDAFGMYNAFGIRSTTSHAPDANGYAAPWTLTKITSPLGGTTTIAYERDQYAHVSEYGTRPITFASDGSRTLTLSATELAKLGRSLTDLIHPKDYLSFTGEIFYTCNYSTPSEPSDGSLKLNNELLQVVGVTANSLTLAKDFNISCGEGVNPDNHGGSLTINIAGNKVGGDVRVASITTTETETNAQYKVLYDYTDGAGNSTGVISKEPASFLDETTTTRRDFDHQFDYPSTPVLYGRVAVLRGPFQKENPSLYNSKEVYTFYTPASGMVTERMEKTGNGFLYATSGTVYDNLLFFNNQVVVNTGLIGRPKSVYTYNQQGQQELGTDFQYTSQVANTSNIANQGHFSEGVLTNELLYQKSYHVNRTTKEYLPAVLAGSRSTRNGVTITNSNVLYDFYTGQVLETAFTNSLGKVYHSRSVPAYTLPGNEEMGAKAEKATNQHMLAQPGAVYTYFELPGGPKYNPLDPLNPQTSRLISASVQTWQNKWTNYREVSGSGNYQDVAGQVPVWRQAATYAWQSPALNADGSFKNFVPFVWTGNPDSRWLKTGETVRYDHYSHTLESRDINGQYATQKTGYNQTQLITSATNARYTELAYSGAEDQLTVGSATHFGGEVVAGGVADKAVAHTGLYSNQLAANQAGFLYRAQAGRDIDVGKTYRVSAWVHANAPAGKLYAAYNGTRIAEVARSSSRTKKAGSWYLLTLLVPIPTAAQGQTVEFGCVNDGNSPGNFDDFRVAPLTATIMSKVYDPQTNNLLYSLDNDNLFTHYEYTPTGRLKRVYQETLDGTGSNSTAEKLVKEYDFNYAQLFFPTWVTTLYRCVTTNEGNNTGYEERKVEDVNPLNNPPVAAKWELNGASRTCSITVCEDINHDGAPRRVRNNICEVAQSAGTDSERCQENGVSGYRVIYHWFWGNGERAVDTYGPCQEGSGGTTSKPQGKP